MNRQGHHFRRQAPFRGYILDFVEHGARLVVELYGVHHFDSDQARHDLKRERILEKEGYRVMHFENGEVQWIGSLVSAIHQEVERRKIRPPPGTLRVPTSPQGGGDSPVPQGEGSLSFRPATKRKPINSVARSAGRRRYASSAISDRARRRPWCRRTPSTARRSSRRSPHAISRRRSPRSRSTSSCRWPGR